MIKVKGHKTEVKFKGLIIISTDKYLSGRQRSTFRQHLSAGYRYPPHEQLGLDHVTSQREITVVERALSLTFVLLKNILVLQQIALMHL